VGKIPWCRAWQPTPVLLPGKSHGQRSLAGYSPWSSKECNTTEWLSTGSGNGWHNSVNILKTTFARNWNKSMLLDN